MDLRQVACNVLLTTCSDCKEEENLLFVTDPTSFDVAQLMWRAAEKFPHKSIIIMDERSMHGEDPDRIVASAMAAADVIFGVTKYSLFHTEARRNAVKLGARFVNMVDYKVTMFDSGGLFADFHKQGEVCTNLSKKMVGDTIKITTKQGTNLVASIKGRQTVPQYARSITKGASSSPPDIECAICAVEGTANGFICIDGSIPHPELGLIYGDVLLEIKNSKIVGITGGEQAKKLAKILRDFNDDTVYWVGEIGVGLNPECKLNGNMLEDEGCAGTLHFGFGSNIGFFGTIDSPFHLDMVIKEPTVEIDGNIIIKDGVIQ